MLAYLALIATAISAFSGAPLWCVAISTAVLATLSISEQRRLAERFVKLEQMPVLQMAAWQSFGYATLACLSAYAVGYASRFAWIVW